MAPLAVSALLFPAACGGNTTPETGGTTGSGGATASSSGETTGAGGATTGAGGATTAVSSATTGVGGGTTGTGVVDMCAPYVIDANGETLLDTTTNLTWVAGPPVQKAGVEAVKYCANLALAGGGWQLPEVETLSALLLPANGGACRINACAFPESCDYFWSATKINGAMMALNFATGSSKGADALSNHLVRCVR